MRKQLLIYETAVPVTPARHARHSVEVGVTYAFSAGINAVPLMAVELVRAADEYAVVFTEVGGDVMPAVVLGVKGDQNLYLAPDGHWTAKYLPAFLRRYPFVFASSPDNMTLTLCVDESCSGLNTAGRGERLFEANGSPTPFVANVLAFLKEYQGQFLRTQAFGRRLRELGLLEPMQAQVTDANGSKLSLSGFLVVNRSKLRALAADQFEALVKTDGLELIYLHLHSLRNFNDLKDRLLSAARPLSLASASSTTSATG